MNDRQPDSASSEINPGGEVVQCPTCGGSAVTKPCRRPFAPSLKACHPTDAEAWQTVNEIIRDAREIYAGYPDELDAINYVYQRIEAAKR